LRKLDELPGDELIKPCRRKFLEMGEKASKPYLTRHAELGSASIFNLTVRAG